MRPQPVVAAPPSTTAWTGEDGLVEFGRLVHVAVPDGSEFFARLDHVAAADVMIRRVITDVMAVQEPMPEAPEELRVNLIRSGRGRYRLDGSPHRADPGSAHVLPGPSSIPFVITSRMEVLQVAIPIETLPEPLRRRSDALLGPLAPSRALRTVAVQADWVLTERTVGAARLVASAVRHLTVGALTGAFAARHAIPLREQILLHIDAHLDDPDLGASSIAAGLGVSVRLVHRTFAGTGTTVGQRIREERALLASRRLRDGHPVRALTELAHQVGFGSRAALVHALHEQDIGGETR